MPKRKRKKPERKRKTTKKTSGQREPQQKRIMIEKTSDEPRCGLCGKRKKLTKTECCGNWICDDADQYVLFSYARNSCYRNHDRYTLCGYHYNEGHTGDWKTCLECRKDFEDNLEMYVYYGTNEYNFEILKNPPKYKPTRCSKCNRIINLGEDGYSMKGKEYFCEKCTDYDW